MVHPSPNVTSSDQLRPLWRRGGSLPPLVLIFCAPALLPWRVDTRFAELIASPAIPCLRLSARASWRAGRRAAVTLALIVALAPLAIAQPAAKPARARHAACRCGAGALGRRHDPGVRSRYSLSQAASGRRGGARAAGARSTSNATSSMPPTSQLDRALRGATARRRRALLLRSRHQPARGAAPRRARRARSPAIGACEAARRRNARGAGSADRSRGGVGSGARRQPDAARRAARPGEAQAHSARLRRRHRALHARRGGGADLRRRLRSRQLLSAAAAARRRAAALRAGDRARPARRDRARRPRPRRCSGLNRPADAIAALQRAVALEPAMGEAWYLLGRAQQASGNRAAAQEAFARAEQLRTGRRRRSGSVRDESDPRSWSRSSRPVVGRKRRRRRASRRRRRRPRPGRRSLRRSHRSRRTRRVRPRLGQHAQGLHHRDHRRRRRVVGLRRRRAARHLSRERIVARSRATAARRRRAPRSFATSGAARSATSPTRPVSPTSGGARAYAPATSTTTGALDLYVTNFGRNRLYRNTGGRFEDVAAKAGVAVDTWSTGCAFGDYDGDGWLDLYVAGYVAFDPAKPPPRRPAQRRRRRRRLDEPTSDAAGRSAWARRSPPAPRSAPIAASRSCAGRSACPARPIISFATTATARSPTSRVPPASRTASASSASASPGSTWTTMGGSICSWPTTRARTICIAIAATAASTT